MKIRMYGRRTRRGITFVELLVSALLMSIGVMGLVGTWAFSFRVTQNTDDLGTAYNVGRYCLEQLKMQGFSTPEGPAAYFYTGTGTGTTSNDPQCRFWVQTLVRSDQVTSGVAGQAGAVPATTALRTVTVDVRRNDNGAYLWRTSTQFVRAGI